MSMRWDPLLARAVATELDARLDRARVRSLLLEPDERRILVYLRESTLVLELHPEAGWISLLGPREPLPSARPLASRVVGVRSLPDESAIVFGLQRVRGKDEGVELVAEFTGNRWNGLVVGYRSRQIRHVLVPRKERERTLEVGHRWDPPPSNERAGRDGELDREGWEAIVGPPGDPERRRKLLSGVAWSSSLNADLLLEGGWERWREMLDPDTWAPHLVPTERGLQPYPFPLGGGERGESFLDAIARARGAAESTSPEHELLLPTRLLERARRRLKKLEGKARGLARELESAGDPAPVRAVGDLILARFHEVPTGTDEVVLTDFEGNEVAVELDPTLSPDGNARRYYDEAARLERVREKLPQQVEAARHAAGEWRERIEAVEAGREPPEGLAELLGPEPEGQRQGKGGESPSLPYHRYRSSGGLEIRVGRGARRNDDLTFHHSRPDDIWMHVREAPGAHVILRWGRKENPPRRDLLEAATLAALASEARNAGTVPVDWTRRKYVRKPRNAPPGAVVPDRVETVFVEPDPDLKNRLEVELS